MLTVFVFCIFISQIISSSSFIELSNGLSSMNEPSFKTFCRKDEWTFINIQYIKIVDFLCNYIIEKSLFSMKLSKDIPRTSLKMTSNWSTKSVVEQSSIHFRIALRCIVQGRCFSILQVVFYKHKTEMNKKYS